MRVPTVEVILASAAVGVLVLLTKRPELPPVPQPASSITGAAASAPLATKPPSAAANATQSGRVSVTTPPQLPLWSIPIRTSCRMTASAGRCVTVAI